ncbi:MAG TPA: Ig-like domain-containing protein [Acidimicrobiia bacterium]|nr:Ig-like domain-containing protein [Acidimicrobiia bacterium]
MSASPLAPEATPPITRSEDPRGRRARSWPRRALIALVGVVGVAMIMGGGWAYAMSQIDSTAASGTFLRAVPRLELVSNPADGAVDVRPDAAVLVTAHYGRIVSAELLDDLDQLIPGALAADGGTWNTAGAALAPGARYRVNLAVETPRGLRHRLWSFSTLTPTDTISARVSPGDGETVGVGQPIVVRFSSGVENKATVEQRLEVRTSTPTVGAWRWFSDSEVHYRPSEYWPANTQIEVDANLAGVDLGEGRWGDRDISTRWQTGDANVSTVDLQTHRMIVTKNGQQVANVPQSSGKDGFPTMTGTLLVLNKQAEVIMDSSTNGIPVEASDGYRTLVHWATRLTNTGIYVHAAPWSVDSQGADNVSHGCVNVSDEWGKWFYDFSQPGDVVNVVGGDRAPSSSDAGSRDWNMSWEEWVGGSAQPSLTIS